MADGGASVILYELNEVPWSVIDLYIENRPNSNFRDLLRSASTFTTVNRDPAHLSPWRTWPTMHRSLYSNEHNSLELGQDPSTFHGDDLWTILDRAGYSVGLFGPLQSWPPQQFSSGGFHVPDTFAHDHHTFPSSLERFQAFNLRMTGENSFSSDAPLVARDLVTVGLDLIRNGLRPRSLGILADHLLKESLDKRNKAARSMMQVVPSFDLFWKLHRRHNPDFSVFFTNHVASMMHRYWGDAVPGYSEEFDYKPDEVFRGFLLKAMDLADSHLGKIMRHVKRSPGSRLIVASSMGQGPVQHRSSRTTMLQLVDANVLVDFLDCGGAEPRLAMYPMYSLEFGSEVDALAATSKLGQITDDEGSPVFGTIEQQGRSLLFRISAVSTSTDASTDVYFNSEPVRRLDYSALGLAVSERLGGDNTAYHIPEGILIDFYGQRAGADSRREEIEVLDFAPSLLANVFSVGPTPTMRGIVRPLFHKSNPELV